MHFQKFENGVAFNVKYLEPFPHDMHVYNFKYFDTHCHISSIADRVRNCRPKLHKGHISGTGGVTGFHMGKDGVTIYNLGTIIPYLTKPNLT